MSNFTTTQYRLICYYSGEENTIAELKKKLGDFHNMDGIKGNGEQYAFFSDGTHYRLAVNTWHGEGKWSVLEL